MGKYQAYPEYVDSGIGWLGDVPKHWERATFKHLLEMMVDNRGRTPPTYDDGIPLLEAKQIDGTLKYTNANFDKFIDKEGHSNFIRDDVIENDILFITVGTIGKTCLVPKDPDFVIAQNIVALRTSDFCSPLFLLFWLRSMAAREAMLATNKDSILDSIKISDFIQSRLYVPQLLEQEKIANFLDHETAKIDTLIEKQQQLIKLLKEKRQAVISHAVTKGLNPNAPMRDSGVEWLGEVPEHWDVMRLSRVGKVGQGNAFSHAIQGQESGDLPWFKCMDMTTIGNEELMNSAANYVDYDLARRIDAPIFPAGTVIFPRVGAALLTNKRRILSRSSVVDDNIYTFIPEKTKVHSRFVYLFLQLIDMATLCSPGLVPTITFGAVNNIRFPMPPLSEQQEIVEHVDRKTSAMDSLIQRAEFAIELMQERRTALISAAVTGKIDVRNWQAPEPTNDQNKEVAA